MRTFWFRPFTYKKGEFFKVQIVTLFIFLKNYFSQARLVGDKTRLAPRIVVTTRKIQVNPIYPESCSFH